MLDKKIGQVHVYEKPIQSPLPSPVKGVLVRKNNEEERVKPIQEEVKAELKKRKNTSIRKKKRRNARTMGKKGKRSCSRL